MDSFLGAGQCNQNGTEGDGGKDLREKSPTRPFTGACLALLLACACLNQSGASREAGSSLTQASATGTFNYTSYAGLLRDYVDARGLVDYRGLSSQTAQLKTFVRQLDQVKEDRYHTWSEPDKIAFWINAYNALTLRVILDNYPIESSLFGSLLYPKNSIRQIPGVWDRLTFGVMGQGLTLNQIEHEILRQEFDEPRLHMALVCAALGCPPLRAEPYQGPILDRQLDDQTRRFLTDAEKFRIDRQKGRVLLSSIFKWYGQDFSSFDAGQGTLTHHGPDRAGVLGFVRRYLPADQQQFLSTGRYKIDYLDYDWSLNESKGAP